MRLPATACAVHHQTGRKHCKDLNEMYRQLGGNAVPDDKIKVTDEVEQGLKQALECIPACLTVSGAGSHAVPDVNWNQPPRCLRSAASSGNR